MPSSLTMVLPIASVCSTCPPVSVLVRAPASLPRGFSRKHGLADFSISFRLASQAVCGADFHAPRPTRFHGDVQNPARGLRLLVGARFQVLFHSPLGVLFTFPSRYWFAIGHRRVFSLGGWSPQVRTGFHVPGATRVPHSQSARIRVRGSHPVPPAFPGRSASARICNCVHGLRPMECAVPQPLMQQRPQACTCMGLGWCGFARRYSRNLG